MASRPPGVCTWPFRQPTDRRYETFTEQRSTPAFIDNGAPAERGYYPGYYSAYVLDPAGANVESVFRERGR